MATRQLHFGRRLQSYGRADRNSSYTAWPKLLSHPLQFWVRLLHPTEYSSNKHGAILDFLLSTVPIYPFSHQPNPGNLVKQLLAKHAEMPSDPVILRLKLKKTDDGLLQGLKTTECNLLEGNDISSVDWDWDSIFIYLFSVWAFCLYACLDACRRGHWSPWNWC